MGIINPKIQYTRKTNFDQYMVYMYFQKGLMYFTIIPKYQYTFFCRVLLKIFGACTSFPNSWWFSVVF